ncbi:MAG: hypothetical protein ABI777_10805, partial [Betaproteobacteria bacterium]
VAVIENKLAPPWCYQDNRTYPITKDGPDKGKFLFNKDACILHTFIQDGKKYEVTSDEYYPKVEQGGGRFSTKCGPNEDCSLVGRCFGDDPDKRCMMTAIESYTSSFNWAETNFAALWLRPYWYLMSDSVITDVQNGGITFVTGGGYTESDLIKGHFALLRNSALIGVTQPGNPYASAVGPFNPKGLSCDSKAGNYCLSAKEGVSFPLSAFSMNQRFFNIYDGPSYQENNAYLAINTTTFEDCTPDSTEPNKCKGSKYMNARILGVPKDKTKNRCYAPNAAIAWKQPNGFYYPPAFHSRNLWFSDVEIRHYVIQPLFTPDSTGSRVYKTDPAAVLTDYCFSAVDMFNGWSDVDRQTELTDEDGSLTGYIKTISVNSDPFFKAPVEQLECASGPAPQDAITATAKTSPYDYVTTVIYPDCAAKNTCGSQDPNLPKPWPPRWDSFCSNESCFGVPMYRQLLTSGEPLTTTSSIRMGGQNTWQRSTLTPNNGRYYLDTTVSLATQSKAAPSVNVFGPLQTYYTFMLFATAETSQTYDIYVGTGFDPNDIAQIWPVQADIRYAPIRTFKPVKVGNDVVWPSTWAKSYNPTTGVLKVTVSMKGYTPFADSLEKARVGKCGPANFCGFQTSAQNPAGACQCNLDKSDPLYPVCSAPSGPPDKITGYQPDACSWSNKDFDCPDGGCYGFAFKTTKDFKTDPSPAPRPAAACVSKKDNPEWVRAFLPADAKTAGTCFNSPISSPGAFCP